MSAHRYQLFPYDVHIDLERSTYTIESSQLSDMNVYRNMLFSSLVENPGILSHQIVSLSQLVDILIDKCHSDFSEKLDKDMVLYFVFDFLGIGFLFAPLVDPDVSEIFINNSDSPIMIEHTLGRFVTNIYSRSEELNSLVSRLSLDSNTSITVNSPTLKTTFNLAGWKCRANLEIPPLSPDGPTGNIRKLPQSPFSLQSLVSRRMITPEIALLFKLITKNLENILIIGLPNSGKTTLAIAIADLLPHNIRRISIEDVEELPKNISTSRTFVPPVASSQTYSTKHKEIIRLLHRTPDWVFLGELQDKHHIVGFLEFLSIGLTGIETSHAASLSHLLSRWIGQLNLSPSLLSNLGWIVLVEHTRNLSNYSAKRYVSKIYRVLSRSSPHCKIISTLNLNDFNGILEVVYWEDFKS